ncbi:MAG TPA: FKBP-type peptidyl-prolyl cis-trans isomerase [Pyrinomonadaceae bacterium]|nr:FKBP-type peptidyl-prolyl cis-trans isomerase [Pyrinomonadaceae bacterium]
MPQSRHRKINRARKVPRVPHSTPSTATTKPSGNRNLQIGAIILVAVIAVAAVAYFITRRGATQEAGGPEITTASGLKIQDLKVGDGESPKPGQTVTVHYIGWLENGKEFNNSYKMGSPAQFRIGRLIKGWDEGLSTMKVGGKRRLFVPSNLAYGATGSPPNIPPNANLKFEIELLGVK